MIIHSKRAIGPASQAVKKQQGVACASVSTTGSCRLCLYCAVCHLSCRYDDLQSTSDNIDLQSTILSRFDLIFVVRDIADTTTDNRIAE